MLALRSLSFEALLLDFETVSFKAGTVLFDSGLSLQGGCLSTQCARCLLLLGDLPVTLLDSCQMPREINLPLMPLHPVV